MIERLPSKHDALSLNPNAEKKKQKPMPESAPPPLQREFAPSASERFLL
jgi:hypothetical protein